MNTAFSVRRLAFAATIGFAGMTTGPASAQDVTGALDALTRMMDLSGYELGFKDVEVNGDEIRINKVRGRLKNADAMRGALDELDIPMDPNGAFELPVPLIIDGLHDSDDGSAYVADKAYLPQMEFNIDDVNVTIDELAYNDLRLPKGDPTFLDMLTWVAGSSIGPITINIDDLLAFEIAPITGETKYTPSRGNGVTELEGKAEAPSIIFHLENAPDPVTGPEAEIFGNESIKGYLSSNVYWSLIDGHMIVRSFVIGAENFGQFSFTFDFTGISADLVEQLMELSRTMDPEDPAAQQQAVALGMGILSRGFFNSFTLRYDDYGVLDRAMTVLEREEDMSRQDMVKELLSEVTEAMTDLELNDLKNKLETEVNKFAADPRNIELRIEPQQPLPLISFMGLAAAPKTLADSLGVTLVANQ